MIYGSKIFYKYTKNCFRGFLIPHSKSATFIRHIRHRFQYTGPPLVRIKVDGNKHASNVPESSVSYNP